MNPALIPYSDTERLQSQLAAPVLEVDLFDLLYELARKPDDPELLDLANHYYYYAEM